MTTSITPSLLGIPVPPPLKKKRVLLVNTSSVKRDLRSEVMRKLGMEVDSAADIAEARSWWRAGLYDLVLIDMTGGLDHGEKFCNDMRAATPPQQLAFLIGAPGYVASSPAPGQQLRIDNGNGVVSQGELVKSLPADLGNSSQRWGILEASRRIGAVRSASAARTRAIQDRPAPRRDYEGKTSKRAMTASLDGLLREEMQ